MGVLGIDAVLNSCVASPVHTQQSVAVLSDVFFGLVSLINAQYAAGRGINLAPLGKLCYIAYNMQHVRAKETKLRPMFVFNQQWLDLYQLTTRTSRFKPDSKIPVLDINYAMISHLTKIPKEVVVASFREIVAHIGMLVSAGKQLSIDLGCGTIVSNLNRGVDFRLNDSERFVDLERAMHLSASAELLGTSAANANFSAERPGTAASQLDHHHGHHHHHHTTTTTTTTTTTAAGGAEGSYHADEYYELGPDGTSMVPYSRVSVSRAGGRGTTTTTAAAALAQRPATRAGGGRPFTPIHESQIMGSATRVQVQEGGYDALPPLQAMEVARSMQRPSTSAYLAGSQTTRPGTSAGFKQNETVWKPQDAEFGRPSSRAMQRTTGSNNMFEASRPMSRQMHTAGGTTSFGDLFRRRDLSDEAQLKLQQTKRLQDTVFERAYQKYEDSIRRDAKDDRDAEEAAIRAADAAEVERARARKRREEAYQDELMRQIEGNAMRKVELRMDRFEPGFANHSSLIPASKNTYEVQLERQRQYGDYLADQIKIREDEKIREKDYIKREEERVVKESQQVMRSMKDMEDRRKAAMGQDLRTFWDRQLHLKALKEVLNSPHTRQNASAKPDYSGPSNYTRTQLLF